MCSLEIWQGPQEWVPYFAYPIFSWTTRLSLLLFCSQYLYLNLHVFSLNFLETVQSLLPRFYPQIMEPKIKQKHQALFVNHICLRPSPLMGSIWDLCKFRTSLHQLVLDSVLLSLIFPLTPGIAPHNELLMSALGNSRKDNSETQVHFGLPFLWRELWTSYVSQSLGNNAVSHCCSAQVAPVTGQLSPTGLHSGCLWDQLCRSSFYPCLKSL